MAATYFRHCDMKKRREKEKGKKSQTSEAASI
jgi:hypothetical protein